MPVWVSGHPLHLFYAACSARPAVTTREAVSMPGLALDEEKGFGSLWWVVLKPQADSSAAESAASLQPPHCRLPHIRSSQGKAHTCVLALFPSLFLITTKQPICYREKILTESFLDNTNSPAQPAFFKILKLILLYNPFLKVTLIVLC